MKARILIDSGPLVALLDRRDRYHVWAKAQIESADPPLVSCEAVLTEACFLLRRIPGGPQTVVDLVQRDLVTVGLSMQEEAAAIKRLLTRYADVPMSLADACLVRLAELDRGSVILTLDSDFKVYRMDRHAVLPTIMPRSR